MYCDIPEFGRCCFCLPLRRGVLAFGYLNVLYSAFMIGVNSYNVHQGHDVHNQVLYKGSVVSGAAGVCIAVYCIEMIVSCFLVYGAHEKNVLFIKIFYYYSITTTLAAVVMQIVEIAQDLHIPMLVLIFVGQCINLYLIFLTRSLLKKLEQGSDHGIDNQLHTIINGEVGVENGIYNNTTVIRSS